MPRKNRRGKGKDASAASAESMEFTDSTAEPAAESPMPTIASTSHEVVPVVSETATEATDAKQREKKKEEEERSAAEPVVGIPMPATASTSHGDVPEVDEPEATQEAKASAEEASCAAQAALETRTPTTATTSHGGVPEVTETEAKQDEKTSAAEARIARRKALAAANAKRKEQMARAEEAAEGKGAETAAASSAESETSVNEQDEKTSAAEARIARRKALAAANAKRKEQMARAEEAAKGEEEETAAASSAKLETLEDEQNILATAARAHEQQETTATSGRKDGMEADKASETSKTSLLKSEHTANETKACHYAEEADKASIDLVADEVRLEAKNTENAEDTRRREEEEKVVGARKGDEEVGAAAEAQRREEESPRREEEQAVEMAAGQAVHEERSEAAEPSSAREEREVECTQEKEMVAQVHALGHEGRDFGRIASRDSFNTDTDVGSDLPVTDDDGEREDVIGARVWAGVEDEDAKSESDDDVVTQRAALTEGGDVVGALREELTDEERILMLALGEVPPEFKLPEPGQGPQWHGDQAFTDLEDVADMDPSFSTSNNDSASSSDGDKGGGTEEEEDAAEEAEDEESDGKADPTAVTANGERRHRAKTNGVAPQANGNSSKEEDVGEHTRDAEEQAVADGDKAGGKKADHKEAGALGEDHHGALTASQRSSVSELFLKKAPEKSQDASRSLPVTWLIVEHAGLPMYQLCEEASWWPHRAKIQEENKRPGVKALIVRTETRGPKSAMYTTYVIHVKTAFHVRGVSRRFSDFSALDRKLRAQYPNAPELLRSNRILGTLSPGFVQERRQHLQEYLDKILADQQLAYCDTIQQFMAINNIPDIRNAQEHRASDPFAEKPWDLEAVNVAGLLQALLECRSAKDAPRETQLLNQIGLFMCEMDNQCEGLVYLQRAVASARLSSDRRALLTCISNYACAHFRFGGHAPAIEHLEEAVEIAQRLGDVSLEARCLRKIALVHASAGEMAAGLRYICEAAELCEAENDESEAASALFTEGIMKYEMGDTVGGVQALEASLVLRCQIKDKLGIAEALNRLGLALIDIGYHLQALDYFERALNLCQEMGDARGEAATLRLLGFVHLAQVDGDRSISLSLFRKSLSLSKKNHDLLGQATCHEGIADVLMDMDDAKSSIEYYTQAMSIREKSTSGNKDPQRVKRHLQLLRSKIARAKAQILEHSMGDDLEFQRSDDDGEDFLWRQSNGLGEDSDTGMENSDLGKNTFVEAPLKGNSNMEFIQQQIASAMTNGAVAFTKLWS